MANMGAKPILVTVAGGIFMYSGIKGSSISATIRDLVSGKNPGNDPGIQAASTMASGGGGSQPTPSRIVHPGKAPKGANTVSPRSIYRYARQAGFGRQTAIVATAVALAESGGNANAHCLNCVPGITEDSRGLWQINVDAHSWALGGNLYDPATNAAAAYQVWRDAGRKFTPWSTFTNGAYSSHMQQALKAAG